MKRKRFCGIYCIENLINKKKYIGQGIDVISRMNNNHRDTPAAYNAIKKYGKENFKRYILVYCEEFELEKLEKACIRIFHSHKTEWGYNISWGGKSPMRGLRHSDVAKEKMSRSGKGRPKSEEWKKKQKERFSGEKNPNFGRKDTEETRQKRIKSHIGLRHSPETIKKMIENHAHLKGEKSSLYGKHLSEDTKKKMSVSKSGENNYNYEKFGRDSKNFGKKRKNASSKYYGVSKQNDKNEYVYWKSYYTDKRIHVYIGIFKTEMDAAIAYDKYIIENNVDRPLNFPENDSDKKFNN